jgi:hypothetical protein
VSEDAPVLVRVGSNAGDLPGLLRAHGVPVPRPVVVLVGGASGLDAEVGRRCAQLLRRAVVPVLERLGACLVDGGTDSGIIALAGQALWAARASSPQVGVVAEGTVRLPGAPADPADGAALEPHHTHVVVVPGSSWGDEAPWLARVATAVAGDRPSVTLLANGGDVAYDDVTHSLAAGRAVLVLGGTGRTADAIVAARHGQPADDRAVAAARSDLVRCVRSEPGELADVLMSALSGAVDR